ncbi:MAG TPA: hypothetical protein ENJ50_02945, partial [Planctomycetaceae bacterium]|nr:hypothetical protein [Planctomycetaceae bacterium]
MRCVITAPVGFRTLVLSFAIGLTVASGASLSADDTPESPPVPSAAGPSEPLQFNRDIRPILSAACFRCHGADANSREGELRLDQRANAVADRGGYRVIVPGDPDQSELMGHITTKDESERMPPPDGRRQLPKTEVELLRRWIRDGGRY